MKEILTQTHPNKKFDFDYLFLIIYLHSYLRMLETRHTLTVFTKDR